ncbi:MAG: DUF349 domain-containing protein [Planctomycetota bacterium]|nr:DUF349 domain-containing protein [Planctomycetota bacterium]MDW8372131.1 DUF349 domain-containing protein [Planctomycetota bacterium]
MSAALRGDAAASARLLADPRAHAAQLAIIAVQDAGGELGCRAVAALAEIGDRQHLRRIAKKAKQEQVRRAAEERLASLAATAAQPSAERLRQERLAALEALIPRATRCAVGGAGEEQLAALAAERDAILARAASVPLDERSQALLERLERLVGEARARHAAQAAAAPPAELAPSAPSPPATPPAPAPAAPEPPEVPETLQRLIDDAEQLAAQPPSGEITARFFQLHKQVLALSRRLPKDHALLQRFFAAWRRHREARRERRAARTAAQQAANEQLASLVHQAEALAQAADQLPPDDRAALEAHRRRLDELRRRFAESVRGVLPSVARPLRDRFRSALDQAYAPLRAARDAADAEAFANQARAQELIEAVRALPLDTDPAAAFTQLRELQARWRKLGPLPRERSRALWEAFRAAGEEAFAKLQPWLKAVDQARQAALARREEIVAAAEALAAASPPGLPGSAAERDALQRAAEQMRALQQRWREAGEVPPGMDRELWRRFRAAQETLWQRLKADRQQLAARREQAVAAYRALLARAERFAADAERAMQTKSGVLTAADILRTVERLRAEAREIRPLPREVREAQEQQLQALIERILATIKDRLDAAEAARQEAAAKRRAILAELDEILHSERPHWQQDAVERLRAAWRDAGAPPPDEREALEQAFRERWERWRALRQAPAETPPQSASSERGGADSGAAPPAAPS